MRISKKLIAREMLFFIVLVQYILTIVLTVQDGIVVASKCNAMSAILGLEDRVPLLDDINNNNIIKIMLKC
jgi:hypothetical protein